MLIYSAFNFQSGKVYVGQTTGSLSERIQGHKDAANSKKGHHTAFRNAIRKYGIKAFNFTILRNCKSHEELNRWECYYIALFGGYEDRELNYNLKDGGYNGKPSKEIVQAQADLLRVKYKGEGNPFYGKTHTDESRAQISKNRKGKLSGSNNPWYGKPMCKSTLVALDIGRKKWHQSEEGKAYMSARIGDKNPASIKFTEEQKKFIIDLRLNQNISMRKTIKLFSEKYFKISDSPVKTVCKYA